MADKSLASRLNHQLALQEQNLVDNGIGGRRAPAGEQKWRDVDPKLWAEVIPLRGDEALKLGVQRSTQLYRVTVRARSAPIVTSQRLLWRGIALNIRSAPPSTDGQSQVLTCESGAPG